MKLPDIETVIRYPGAPHAAVILLALAAVCFMAWVTPEPVTLAPCGVEQVVRDMPTYKDTSDPSWQWPIAEVEEDEAPEPEARAEDEPPRRHHRRRHWRR